MKMIYVSHPYTGNEEHNVADAADITRLLAQETNGTVLYINPLAIFKDMAGILSYDEIMKQCLALLHCCDGAVFCDGWKKSRGCKEEMEYCKEYDIPHWEGPEAFTAHYLRRHQDG